MRPQAGPDALSVRYEIRLLGPFAVLQHGVPVAPEKIGSRKARILLKLLLVDRERVVGVEELAWALWPERVPDQPERHLATLVSRLRAALGSDVVVRRGDGYHYGGEPPEYVVDVAVAERLTAEAEVRLASGEPGLAHAAAGRALELLGRGQLLADEPYAEWAEPARASTNVLLGRARRAGWAAALLVHDVDTAVRAAEAALAAEPFDEEAARALMRAHHGRGEPAKALAAFERLRSTLADELGTDPAPETRDLHLAILRGEPAADVAVATASTDRDGSEAAVVGRDAEVGWLRRMWSAAAGGNAGLALVVGEAGIGKTTLAAELVQLAEATGATVARTRCYEAERSLFLQPIVDALRPVVVSSTPQLVSEAAGAAAGSLAELIPEIGAVLDTSEYLRASPDVERRRVFEAVVRFVRGLADRRPVLLFLDDLHLAGSSTLEIVHFLLRRATASRVLVLATVRVEEGAEVLDMLGEVAEQRYLGPLSEKAVRELVGRSGLAELATPIMAQTRGHSLFVVETLRALSGETAKPDDLAVPESLRTAVVARIRRAGPHVEETLRAAAVLGGSFDPGLLAELMDEPLEEAARAADAASRARLLVESGTRYEFANDLIQEIAYESTPLPVRAARHRRAATLLFGSPEAVAHHAIRAGDWSAAVEASLEAAETASKRYANREAERLLDQAMQVAVRADDPVGVARARHARGVIRETLADYQGAYEDHSAVAKVARAEARADLELAALNSLGGDLLVGLGRPSRDCVPYLESALAIAETTGDVPAQVDILGRLAVIWTNRLRFDLARRYADQAVALADERPDHTVQALALDAVKNTMAYSGDVGGLEKVLPRLQAHLERYRQGLLRYRAPGLEAWAVFESAFPLLAQARWPEATTRLEEALKIMRESGFVAYESPCLAHLAWVQRARGRYGEALRLGAEATEAAAATGHRWWVAYAETMLGWILTDVGALDEAATRLRRGREAAERDEAEAYVVRCLGHLAWVSWLRGEEKTALQLVERTETLFGAVTGAPFLHGAHAALAAASVRVARGEGDGVRRLVEPVREAAEKAGWVETQAWAAVLLAECQVLDGDADRARRLAAAALELSEQHQLPGIAWQAHTLLARVSPREPAGTHLAAAAAIVNELAASLDDPARTAAFRAAADRRIRWLTGASA